MAKDRRMYKIAEKLRGIIATHLFRVADDRFTLVTITSVKVSNDLRSAKVYWNVTGGESRKQEVEEAFSDCRGYFRRSVGEELGTKCVPELKFFYDETLDISDRVNKLMQKVKETEHSTGNE